MAIASWLALGAASLASARFGLRGHVPSRVMIAGLFFLSAAATRYWLRETRSRWQIVAFAIAALLAAFDHRRRVEPTAGLLDWAVWVGCAAAAIMLVRWMTEGSPI